ncbi:hypothetical protein LY15_001093 [Prauserella flava]|nr:hypothetical protein [Prauserella sediminis]MCR3719132.1 hypothetical protein [Prauserella flava]MCR3735855.1 hypothetical protein [Prauserella salsuginis]
MSTLNRWTEQAKGLSSYLVGLIPALLIAAFGVAALVAMPTVVGLVVVGALTAGGLGFYLWRAR